MLHIIITIDYEIFGDGTGDVKRHMIEPTNRILNIFDKYGVPLTIMFELTEYFKFIEYDPHIKKDMGYSYADAVRKQVLDAYHRGHDVQLHVHPQWLDAEYKDSKWVMNDAKLSVSKMSPDKIDRLITAGKNELEGLIRTVDPTYICEVLRLTNLPWCEAPQVVFEAMKKNKLIAHSLAVSDNPRNSERGYWMLDEEWPLFEIPIHSMKLPAYKAMSFYRVATALYRRKYTRGTVSMGSHESVGKKSFIERLTEPYVVKWDFCKQSSQEMLTFLDGGLEKYDHERNEVPLIMIAHSKDFFNAGNLDTFLRDAIKRKSKVKFSSFGDFVSSYLK